MGLSATSVGTAGDETGSLADLPVTTVSVTNARSAWTVTCFTTICCCLASMLVEPFSLRCHRPSGLVSEREIPQARLEILWGLRPGSPVHRERGLVSRHQLRDEDALRIATRIVGGIGIPTHLGS